MNALRIYQSRGVNHCPIKLELENKESRKKCVLCCKKNIGRNATHYCSICLVPLCTSLFRGANGQSSLQTCFQRFHSCIDVPRQNNCSHEWLIESRNFDNRKSNKVTKGNQNEDREDETTLEEQSQINAKRTASSALTPVPSTVKVTKVEG